MTRVLLIGASGQVGSELVRSLAPLGEVIAVSRDRCDLSRTDTLRAWIEALKPEIVVNAAAYTAVDQAESEPDLAMKVNAEAPAAMAAAALSLGALLVHFSTDYVYDGTKQGTYIEDDVPHPLGSYGRSKLAGDEAVLASGCDALIFRTSWVYGPRGKNFLRTILRLAGERETLKVVADQFGAPTSARLIANTVANVLPSCMAAREAGEFESALFHLCASGEASWHDFASRIVLEARGRGWSLACREVLPIPAVHYPLPALRPANSRLSCAKLANGFQVSLPGWQADLSITMDAIDNIELFKSN